METSQLIFNLQALADDLKTFYENSDRVDIEAERVPDGIRVKREKRPVQINLAETRARGATLVENLGEDGLPRFAERLWDVLDALDTGALDVLAVAHEIYGLTRDLKTRQKLESFATTAADNPPAGQDATADTQPAGQADTQADTTDTGDSGYLHDDAGIAKKAGVTSRTVKDWRLRQGLPYTYLNGRVKIKISDYEKWKNDRSGSPKSNLPTKKS